jgi:hypothetical protein
MVSSATPISPLRRHALNCTALFQTNGRFAPIPAIQQLISFLLYYLLISRELTQLCNFLFRRELESLRIEFVGP